MGRLGGGQVAVVGKHGGAAGAIGVVAGALARLHLDRHEAGAVAVVTHAVAAAGQGGAGGVWAGVERGLGPPAAGGKVAIAESIEDGIHGDGAVIHFSILLRMTGVGRIGLQTGTAVGGGWRGRRRMDGGNGNERRGPKYFTVPSREIFHREFAGEEFLRFGEQQEKRKE